MNTYNRNRMRNKMKEDFSPTSVNRVVVLIGKVLSKRLGTSLAFSTVPMTFIRDGQHLEGVISLFDKTRALRLNWKQGQSAEIVSIDVWNKIQNEPSITIDTEGFNIVSVIDGIVGAIKSGQPGFFDVKESKGIKNKLQVLKERGIGTVINITPDLVPSKRKSVEFASSLTAFYLDSKYDQVKLQDTRLSQQYREYEYWYKEKGVYEEYEFVNQNYFETTIKNYLSYHKIDYLFAQRLKVTKSGKEVRLINPKSKKVWDDNVFDMTLSDSMKQIEAGITAVAKGLRTSIMITGTAGIGKSKTMFETLNSLGFKEITSPKQIGGKKYVVLSGEIKNTRALYETLYYYNDPNLIIVFDDLNAILKKADLVEMMRIALTKDKGGGRNITFTDNKITQTSRKIKPYLNFKSKIVILTNRPKSKVDPAIVSRTAPIEIDASTQTIVDAIRADIDKIEPNVPLKDKMDILDFIEYELKMKINKIDFRLFQDAIMWQQSDASGFMWKKWVRQILI